jgi:hypothetical protein
MTTNTNPSRSTARRFFASTEPTAEGVYTITDRTDDSVVVTIKGRTHARFFAARLSEFDPAPRDAEPVKAAKPAKAKKATKAEPVTDAKRTSHADCAHVATKMARAICRKERAKASA